MYLVNIRPDICYAMNQVSQAMVKLTKIFSKARKHVLRYLRGTSDYGLWYRQMDEVKLHGFMDADWAGSPTGRNSTSGGIFNIGSTTVSWSTLNINLFSWSTLFQYTDLENQWVEGITQFLELIGGSCMEESVRTEVEKLWQSWKRSSWSCYYV